MTEERENTPLRYPKMDIDFHSREEHNKGTSHYYSSIVTKIQYLVEYRCCSCGAENRDEDQFFAFKRRAHAYDPQTQIEKEEQIIRDIKNQQGIDVAAEKEKLIAARRYDLLGLKCRCAYCRKKQPWSDFWPVEGTIAGIKRLFENAEIEVYKYLLYFSLIVLAFALYGLFLGYPLAGVGVIILLFVPSIAALVHNKRSQQKSLRLDESYRPEIRIVYKSE